MKGLVMLTVFAVAAFGATGAHAEDLEAGDMAPAFDPAGKRREHPSVSRLRGQDGRASVVPEGVHWWLNRRVQVAA